MALFTKSIFAERSAHDGCRISVMSRHTLNDGVTPHPGIDKSRYDVWMRELAPSADLVGDYYKRGLSWEVFAARYLAELRTEEKRVIVKALALEALRHDVTLMCAESKPAHCHRRLLAEECQRLEHRLTVTIH